MTALFFGKRFAYLVAFVAGSTIHVTDKDFLTDIGSFTTKAFCAEVVRVVKNSSGLHVI
jgi:hypothetical protein